MWGLVKTKETLSPQPAILEKEGFPNFIDSAVGGCTQDLLLLFRQHNVYFRRKLIFISLKRTGARSVNARGGGKVFRVSLSHFGVLEFM